jgi:hypothetical protein
MVKVGLVQANGLINPFTNKKKWRITCGKCNHTWDERCPIMEPSSAICPACREQNIWSYNEFVRHYNQLYPD